ncbi:MAG TPA: fused MFS/spermidine synthase [Candidatus Limnocylindrales bacterium]
MTEPGAVIDGIDLTLAMPRPRRLAVPSAAVLAFGGVIGWSAFLLFSVEPLIGRVVLPVFGGTPAVWATTLFFFQAVLLLGYLYGHVSVTRLGLRRGAILHVALIAVAAASLLIAPSHAADLRDPAIPDVLNLIGMLTLTVGLPAFVLTTTTPLVSAWYAASRSGPGAADGGVVGDGDAYWLYALSNTGSLLALLAYPFVIEPRLGLTVQRGVWAVGFVVFGVAVAGCAAWAGNRARGHVRDAAAAHEATDHAAAATRIVWRRRATWLLLAAVPSGLLNAVTTFISTDLVAAPLLWLAPLAIYLATFIIAFSSRGRRLVPAAVIVAPAAITLMWVPYGSAGGWPILPLVLLMYGGLGVVATALHGRLALDRPAAVHLTEFYLVISIGGALASAFVALIAPVVFPGVWEFPILLVLALAALAVSNSHVRHAERSTARRRGLDLSPFFANAGVRMVPYLAVALALGLFLVREGSLATEAGIRWLLVGGLILLVGARGAFLTASTGLVLALAVLVLQPAVIYRDRSFFGVTEVLRPVGATHTTLMNGTTVHGLQSTDPAKAQLPTAYYATKGPFGDVFRDLASDGRPKTIGIVGLGAGALTSYLQPGWSMTYYEIDPVVAEVASDPRYFTFLSAAATRPAIVLGDARLSLQSVPNGQFDMLFIDAFSSDAVPTHLLTTEAYATYARVVKPGGIVITHIPNRYYDLAPAVAGALQAQGLSGAIRVFGGDKAAEATPTILTVGARDATELDPLLTDGWQPLRATVAPMTDDFMDILRFLRPLW